MKPPSPEFPDDLRPDSSPVDQVASVSERQTGHIRLGCYSCDRSDFDGVEELPTDWSDIVPVQSWEESIRPVEIDSEDGRSALDWQTHLGTCPACLECPAGTGRFCSFLAMKP